MPKENYSIIVAPHPDDEVIGCFEILNDPSKKIIIIYDKNNSEERKLEALKLNEYFPNIEKQLFVSSFPKEYISYDNTYYFPDLINEVHPSHRYWGAIGELIVRDEFDVIFYSTLMNVPWMHEVKDKDKKLDILNNVYKSQKDLWKYEYKYFLWEARYQWIF